MLDHRAHHCVHLHYQRGIRQDAEKLTQAEHVGPHPSRRRRLERHWCLLVHSHLRVKEWCKTD